MAEETKKEVATKVLEFTAIGEDRSLIPVATFIEYPDLCEFSKTDQPDQKSPAIPRFAAGWKFAVNESFQDALDIKPTKRMIAKKEHNVLTQGRVYTFKLGDTIHDVPGRFKTWADVMKTLTVLLQVMDSSPSGYVSQETVSIAGELGATIQKKEKDPKQETIGGIKVDRVRFQPGFVRFDEYRPNEDRTALIKTKMYDTTQEDFVSLLQFGVLRTADGETIDFFNT